MAKSKKKYCYLFREEQEEFTEKEQIKVKDTAVGETFAFRRQIEMNVNVLLFGCDGVRCFPQDV